MSCRNPHSGAAAGAIGGLFELNSLLNQGGLWIALRRQLQPSLRLLALFTAFFRLGLRSELLPKSFRFNRNVLLIRRPATSTVSSHQSARQTIIFLYWSFSRISCSALQRVTSSSLERRLSFYWYRRKKFLRCHCRNKFKRLFSHDKCLNRRFADLSRALRNRFSNLHLQKKVQTRLPLKQCLVHKEG